MNVISVDFFFYRPDKKNFLVSNHSHKCYELVYYKTGKGYCYIDKTKYNYADNTCVLIPPNAKHNDVHEDDCNIFCIGFSLDSNDSLPALSFLDKDKKILYYLETISFEFAHRSIDFLSVINNCMDNIAIEILRTITAYKENGSHDSVVKQVIKYLDEYYTTDISAEQLAGIANYSYHHFRHIFKEIVGVSIKQYIIQKRINLAQTLLTNTQLSITNIAYKCGFSSTSLFIKQFKDNINMTPAKYRRQLHSNTVFHDEQSDYGKKE